MLKIAARGANAANAVGKVSDQQLQNLLLLACNLFFLLVSP